MPPDQIQSIDITPNERKISNRALWILAVIIVILLAALYEFTSFGFYVQSFFVKTSIPQELSSTLFFSDRTPNKTSVYEFGRGSNLPIEQRNDVIVSETVDPSGSARITHNAKGIFTVVLDGKPVMWDQVARIGINRSPDGASVVFAQQAMGTSRFISLASTPMTPIDSKNWEVVVYNPSANTVINLGAGVSPFFVDQTHVAWIAPAGLSIADLSTKTITLLVKNLGIHALSVSLVSPDHTTIAWYDAPSKVLTAYKVTPTSATALPTTTVVNGTSSVHSLSLGNDGVYLIRLVGGDSQVFKELFGQSATNIGNVPSFFGIGRMLLGSI